MLNNELLMDAAALVNSNEAKIAQLQADVEWLRNVWLR